MCSVDVANDEELLTAMADAGCFNILIGFESLNPESLNAAQKHHNLGGTVYEEAIQKIHAHGIHINASFVVGFDNDTLEEFDRIYDFTLKNNLPNVNLHLLHAPPGSDLYKRYHTEGRLLTYDDEWEADYLPAIHYKHMSHLDLFDKYMQTVSRLYSFETVLRKAKKLFTDGAFTRSGGEIPVKLKIRLSWITIREFVLTKDKNRRELFWFIMDLLRSKKVSVDKGLGFLLTMLGINRHIETHKRNISKYREMILSREIE